MSGNTVPKIRLIDDLSAPGTNRTVTTTEKLNLGGIDEAVGIAKLFVLSAAETQAVFKTEDGPDICCLVHEEWHKTKAVCKGRTLDLKAAYKQLAVNAADYDVSLVTVYNPKKKQPEMWRLLALPFGATASVYSFNRMARVIERIMSSVLKLLVSGYFDDYAQLEDSRLTKSATDSSEALLVLIGWTFAKSGKKYFVCLRLCLHFLAPR